MNSISAHMRITGSTVTDADVDSRTAATAVLASAWGKQKDGMKAVRKAADVAASLAGDGNPSEELGLEVQNVVKESSSSFLYEERPLEVGICAGMAMASVVSQTSTAPLADIYATALWSALSYQSPLVDQDKRERMRSEVLDAARNRSLEGAEKARIRREVVDPTDIVLTVDESGKATASMKKAVTLSIEALRRNAAIDREELDFLWWAQLGRSRLLDRQLGDLGEPTRIVAAGIEAAAQLRRLPCQVHREIVLRTLADNPELTLGELLEAIGEDREAIAAKSGAEFVEEIPGVFPLLQALRSGVVPEGNRQVKRSVSDWGSRALLEAGLVRILINGVGCL